MTKFYFNRGLERGKAKDYKGEIEDYNKALELNPSTINTWSLYMNRGVAKHNINDLLGAMDDYKLAVALLPNKANAYFNLGCINYVLKNYQDSIISFTKAIDLNGKDWIAYKKRGNAKVDIMDYKGATEDYNKAIELKPDKAGEFNPTCEQLLLNIQSGKIDKTHSNETHSFYNEEHIENNIDNDRETFNAMTDGTLGDYEDFDGDIDDIMTWAGKD